MCKQCPTAGTIAATAAKPTARSGAAGSRSGHGAIERSTGGVKVPPYSLWCLDGCSGMELESGEECRPHHNGPLPGILKAAAGRRRNKSGTSLGPPDLSRHLPHSTLGPRFKDLGPIAFKGGHSPVQPSRSPSTGCSSRDAHGIHDLAVQALDEGTTRRPLFPERMVGWIPAPRGKADELH